MDKKRILENANEVLHEVGNEVHSEPDSPLGIFKKYSKLSFFWRIMTAFLGQVICGIGVAFMVFAKLGVDPASVFTTGVANQMGVSYGNALFFVQMALMLIVFFWDRHYLNIASFMAVFLIGYAVDFTIFIFSYLLPLANVLGLQVLYVCLGLIILGFGIPIYIHAGIGVSPVDCLAEIISNKWGFNYRWVRMGSDFTFACCGFLLGALGFATVASALATGPLVSLTRPLVQKYIRFRD